MGLVPDFTIVFELDGERRKMHYKKLPFSAWSELKAQLGFTPTSLLEAIQAFDIEAFAAIIWLERKQNERGLRWITVRNELSRHEPDIKFVDILVDGESAGGEDEPEEEPDPTISGS